jgi:predicted unusual protein kinase regulating ubiquinone biosynthesis (AarF/ABC1/UbiB family)
MEFGVSSAAVAQWESGERICSGAALKLLELYEGDLGLVLTDNADRGAWPETSPVKRSVNAGLATLTLVIVQGLAGSRVDGALARTLRRRLIGSYVARLGEMKGLATKIGQLFSDIGFFLDEDERLSLMRMQTIGRAIPPSMLARIFRRAFGETPGKLFAEWTPTPLAMASIGQVHRARLHSGEVVAVKVQYPSVVETIKRDLAGISSLHELTAALSGAQTPGAVYEAWREHILAECDYQQESRNQRAFADIFAGRDEILIPEIFPSHSGTEILTQRYIEGRAFDSFCRTAPQEDRDRAGAIIWSFVYEAILGHHLLYADIHPGNFLFPDRRVAFLDFGRVQRLSTGFVSTYAELARAILRESSMEELTPYVLASVKIPQPAKFNFDHNHRALFHLFAPCRSETPFHFTPEFVRVAWKMVMTENPNSGLVDLTRDHAFLHQLQLGLYSVLAQLGARFDARTPYLRALSMQASSRDAHV